MNARFGTRLATAAAIATIVALGASGCTFIAPQATRFAYDPADGVGANLGEVKIRDVQAVADAVHPEHLNLVFYASNGSLEDIALNYSVETDSGALTGSITLPGNRDFELGIPAKAEVHVVHVDGPKDVELGGLYPVYFQAGIADGIELLVPVLDDGGRPHLTEYLPTAD